MRASRLGRPSTNVPGSVKEALAVSDFRVEDRLDRVVRHGIDGDQPADGAHEVAGLEVMGHRPALAGPPEAVDAGGDDGPGAQGDLERLVGGIVGDGQDRLIAQDAGRGVLVQHSVAQLWSTRPRPLVILGGYQGQHPWEPPGAAGR